jgi:hypothetical protein
MKLKLALLSCTIAAPLIAQIPAPPQETEAMRSAAHARLEVTPGDLKMAAEAADRWLKLMDQGKYGESWDISSNIFRYKLKKDEWIKAATKLRAPVGRMISRQLMNEIPKKNPTGLPEGLYMVLAYRSSFSNRPRAIELVTMVLSTNDQWKVLYYENVEEHDAPPNSQ